MPEIENKYQLLIDKIYEAFSDVPYPGDDHILGPGNSPHLQTCGECRWLYDSLVGKTWQEVLNNESLHGALSHAMSFFEPVGWRYYLPAYLISKIRKGIYSSLYFEQKREEGLAQLQAERINKMTEFQCRIIITYLTIVVREEKQSDFVQKSNIEAWRFWHLKYDEMMARLNEVPRLIAELRQTWQGSEAELERQLHRYYLACCRAIWRLLPQEDSRRGIEVAERYVDGLATGKELSEVDYFVEGAAFNIDYNCDPEEVKQMVDEVEAIPREELQQFLHPPQTIILSRELLKRAAYFADFAVVYPNLTPKDPDVRHVPFLSAKIFREIFGEQKNTRTEE
jgi:hypothetical protein